MTAVLPASFRWRRPTLDDAGAMLGLIAEHHNNVIGFVDSTLDEVRDELSEPGFDPANDGWVVEDEAGAMLGFGLALGKGDSDMVDIDPCAPDDAVSDWLWAQLLGRAGEIGARAGHDAVRVDIGIYQTDAVEQARARSHGFAPATSFERMRIDFGEAPLEPAVGDGVVVRVGPGDEAFRRHAQSVSTRAFVDHFGFVERTFEAWHEAVEASVTHDWAQLRVAYLAGEPVAMLRGTDQFVEDTNCGYVATVAVLPEARGSGLAKLLLRQAFVDDFRRGRRGTILHVDSNNATPAMGLYQSVGMRSVLAIDIWSALVTPS